MLLCKISLINVHYRHHDESTQSCIVADSMPHTVQDPEGVLEHKLDETAFVDSSSDLNETFMPFVAPKVETGPLEDTPTDYSWSSFNEDVPLDSPAQHLQRKYCIPKAFDADFSSVLYSTCETYQQWVTEAADVIQNSRELAVKVCTSNFSVEFCMNLSSKTGQSYRIH